MWRRMAATYGMCCAEYIHEVVFAVLEFVEDYHAIGAYPAQDPEFPHMVVKDTVGAPVFLGLE